MPSRILWTFTQDNGLGLCFETVIERDGEIDYRKFSAAQLGEALSHIRADKYPKNYQNLIAEFSRRGIDTGLSDSGGLPPDATTSDSVEDSKSQEGTKSQFGARVLGLVTMLLGIAMYFFRHEDGVYTGSRSFEYTFEDDPIFLTIIFLLNGLIVLTGFLGLVFGKEFYDSLAKKKKAPD